MRRVIISIILILSLLSVSSTRVSTPLSTSSSSTLDYTPTNSVLMSQITHSGSSVPVNQYLNRLFSEQVLTISNSYALPDIHENTIDLSSYQIPGWTLYKVILDYDNITAIEEREVVGSNSTTSASIAYAIYEHDIDLYYDQLAQGFYNMGHDGQLQNVSILYMSPTYDPANHNYAYIDIRSDYQDGSTNMVSSVQLENVGLSATWANITEPVILDSSTTYYVVMNGSLLIEFLTFYPDIRWYYENVAESFLTRRHNTDGDTWGSDRPFEAILNYTYVPWNKTSNSALVYSYPADVSLMLNGTPVSGSSWSISSGTNITSLQISSDQSVNVVYNLTLCYTQDISANSLWKASTSGAPILWNVTTDLSYPAVSNIVAQFMNITNIPLDWTETGLYLGTSPAGSYVKSGTVVTCTGLSDGTWTFTSTAPNYAVDLALYDSSDDSLIIYKVANLVIMDVNATIEDGVGTPMTDGTTNLSILQLTNLIYSPLEKPASNGAVSFSWDISSTTDGNSTHSVEVYWISTDELEAGYITQNVFVYHSTTLVADDLSISDFTEDSFTIGINFDKISPAQGLDDTLADVTYSFGSTINASLTDAGGGRWTQIIDTTGMSNGVHLLTVYAEGYALENHSLVITVDLAHQTQALNWSWSNTDNITYTNSTNLSISYIMQDGTTRISGATVNITIEGVPHDMTWDGLTGTYWIELTGENFTGVGTFSLDVIAWKVGYEPQTSEINITVRSETTGLFFDVEYNPTDLNISYIESLFIQVTYNFNSIPINSSTLVRVTFNGSTPVELIFNPVSSKWETTLLGIDYLGAWNILVRATSVGFDAMNDTAVFSVYEDIPILSSSWSGDVETTDYATNAPLIITLTDSSGTPITDANVSFTAFGTPYLLLTGPGGLYSFNIDPTETRGVETFIVYVVREGFVSSQISLNLTVEATTSLQFHNLLSSEYEQWNLTIEVRYMDTFYSSAIENATVIVNLDGVDYILQYSSAAEVYTIEITLDLDPGDYTIYVSAFAEYAAYATNQAAFTVNAKEYVYLEVTFDGNLIAGQFMEIIATLRSNNTGNPAIPGETIRFEVSVYFENGTVLHYTGPTMIDSTNTEGVASVGFEVPFGNVDRLTARAIYDGSRTRWGTERTEVAGVEVSLLSLLLAFFTSGVGLMIVISMALLGIVATGYNKAVKPRKRAARLSLENQLQMFKDLETVQHFMAVYLDRGTCVFYHPFTEDRIQPDLISGFIAAITSVYGEIKGDGVRGTLEEIQYHGLRLNSYSGQYIIGILILEGEMTPLLRERLQFFVELFENQYDQDLDGWTGLIDCFDPEWVVSTLNSAFNYAWHLPHRFGPTQKVSKTDARMLDYISAVRDDKNEFYIKDIISPLAEMLEKTEPEVLDRLLLLQDRGVIVPIGVQTILQRQGLALVDGSEQPMLEPSQIVREEKVEDQIEPEKATPEHAEELEFEEIKEEVTIEPQEEEVAEPEPQIDPMDAFVQDVESLLVEKAKEEKKEKKKDDELDQFVKELRAKIGEDEETED
ncbi:MAG: hypothetical protein AM325_013470 [Candidatus Thorarchaeota archaeon SMTZ1-45]|nr:MAG: hypothetical protein AM325_15000 [Candidatus Thorarchaeota archaeon SMTZ1-45]